MSGLVDAVDPIALSLNIMRRLPPNRIEQVRCYCSLLLQHILFDEISSGEQCFLELYNAAFNKIVISQVYNITLTTVTTSKNPSEPKWPPKPLP